MLKLKNGRIAHPGDHVLDLASGTSGTLANLNQAETTANAKLVPIPESLRNRAGENPVVTVSECLHVEDIRGAANGILNQNATQDATLETELKAKAQAEPASEAEANYRVESAPEAEPANYVAQSRRKK